MAIGVHVTFTALVVFIMIEHGSFISMFFIHGLDVGMYVLRRCFSGENHFVP